MTDLITTHPNADFDGVASMVAARHFYADAVLALSGSAETQVRAFIAGLDITIHTPRQVDMATIDRVVLCDIHTPERAGHFAALAASVPLHAFDHHPQLSDDAPLQRAVIESVGATSTLMTEQLIAANIILAPWEATLLALGIYEETGSLTYSTTTLRDMQAATWLLAQGADLPTVGKLLTHELTLEQLTLMDHLAHQLDTRYPSGFKVGVATAYTDDFIPEVASIANRLLAMQPMDAIILLIAMGDKTHLVARGNHPLIPLHTLAQSFGGGGHPTACAATIHEQTLIETTHEVWQRLEALLSPLRKARDLMTKGPVTISHNASLADAEALLTRYGVNTVPVMDGPKLHGIVSRDSVQKALFHQMGQLPVTEVMDAHPYTADLDTPLTEVQDQLINDNLSFVPVLGKHGLVGCITRTDILRAMHQDLQAQRPGKLRSAQRPRNIRDLMRQQLPEGLYQLLRDFGTEGEQAGVEIYLVGGMVRDLILGRDNLDVDLVVEGDAIPFATHWHTRNGGHLHTHKRFATATLNIVDRDDLPRDFKVDLASARTEFYEYPTALPTVEHSSLKKDLYRRDFTINALAVSLSPQSFGSLMDYFGGQRDIATGRIRVLHTLSITEDPTRALRAVRFASRYNFEMGAQTRRLIHNAQRQGLFARLSGKRLLTELHYLLSDRDPEAGIRALDHYGILAGIDAHFTPIPPDDSTLTRIGDAIAWHRLTFFDVEMAPWQVYLLGLSDYLPATHRKAFWRRLDLPGRVRSRWVRWQPRLAASINHLAQPPENNPLAIYQALHGAPVEMLLHLMASTESEWVQQSVSHYLTQLADVRPHLTGHDLKAMGIEPGPRYQKLLQKLLWARLQGHAPDRAAELALIARW